MTEKMTPAQIRQTEKNAAAEGFLHRVAVAADQDLNVDTGGLPDETISSRVRRISDAHSRWDWNPGVWLAKTLNAGLNFIQRNHGQHAQAGDLERALKVAATEQVALGLPDAAPQVKTARTGGTRSREASEAKPYVTNSDR
jgi:hypothetical protein